MLKKHLTKLILPWLIVFSSWVQAEPQFSQIYIFGDDLSDAGNLGSLGIMLPEPYYMNRISNGPVAVEILAEKLGRTADASMHLQGPSVGTNYAFAGTSVLSEFPYDLNTQIVHFQSDHNYLAPADALYVVFIGSNDIRNARGFIDFDLSDARLKLLAAVDGVRLSIETLIQSGARSFMLVNSLDIGAIPETRSIANFNDNPVLIEHARRLSEFYRIELHSMVNRLVISNDINIVEFDLYRFFNELLDNAESLGFTNSTDACFRLINNFHPDCDFGANFDEFVFFDNARPTARVHRLIGEAMFQALE